MKKKKKMKLAPEGKKIIITVAFISLGLAGAGSVLHSALLINLFRIFAIFLLFCMNFFRDPARNTPTEENLIVSPADGKIVKVEKVNDPEVGADSTLVSIFLNVFNVHRNRVPFTGKIIERTYRKGKFLAAFDHKASDENEQSIILMDTVAGKMKVKQIAGLIARRILCYATKGSEMAKGDNFGFIMFGSRTDLIIPGNIKVLVKVGQKVTGGETIVGEISQKENDETKA